MQHHKFEVDEISNKKRLDVFLSECLPNISRSRLKKLINDSRVMVNSKPRSAGYKVRTKEKIGVEIPLIEPLKTTSENIPLNIVFEDEYLLAINKPAGMVVHPAPGHYTGTLVNALLYHCNDLSGIGGVERPGIVHRLDKETSGLVLVAKTEATHKALALKFKKREIKKEYLSFVKGNVKKNKGSIESLIGRHKTHRKKMIAVRNNGRSACTHYEVLQRFKNYTYIKLQPETGRTHQIRVHMASINHPVIGDKLYGGKNPNLGNFKMERHALHACQLEFKHPILEKPLSLRASLPTDMEKILKSQNCL
tara:strand:+ start:873 stop:1796 length:924 start_codon:yes stop_codon:yes gene_type:complete